MSKRLRALESVEHQLQRWLKEARLPKGIELAVVAESSHDPEKTIFKVIASAAPRQRVAPQNPHIRLVHALVTFGYLIHSDYLRSCEDAPLPPLQVFILMTAFLSPTQSVRPTHVANLLHLFPTITETIRQLCGKGLLALAPIQSDRRSKAYQLTAKSEEPLRFMGAEWTRQTQHLSQRQIRLMQTQITALQEQLRSHVTRSTQ